MQLHVFLYLFRLLAHPMAQKYSVQWSFYTTKILDSSTLETIIFQKGGIWAYVRILYST